MSSSIAEHKVLKDEWNEERNYPLKSNDVTFGSSKKVWWICKKGHEWQASIKNRVSKNSGCPFCTNKFASPENNLKNNFPKVAQQWNQQKNKSLSPQDVTFGSSKKVWWICKEGHEWQASVTSRTKKKPTGCPFCSGNQLSSENSLSIKNPLLTKEWNFSKNSDLNPDQISFGSSKKVWWICKKGHEWQASISNRVSRNSGCPYCNSKKATKENNFAESFPQLLSQWDYQLNKSRKPNEYTPKSKTKVWWLCDNRHSWKATIQSRANGSGCPFCSNQSSKPEMRLLAEFRFLFSNVENRKKFGRDEIDIYLPSMNIGIEFDGSFFHKNKERKDKDKNDRLLKEGIRVIRIRPFPLLKISKYDLIPESEELTKKDLNCLLLAIFKITDSSIPFFVKNYLKEKDFQNDQLFKLYISYFPNPLPEKSLKNTHPSISAEWDLVKNNPLAPENFTHGSNQKCWWICEKGHSYETSIVSRTSGHGCPFCSGNAVSTTNSFASFNSVLVSEFDLIKNSPLTPNEFTIGSTKKVWWICKSGHSWKASLYNRTKTKNPSGCPYCSNKKANAENNLLVNFPDLMKQWNYEKNVDLRPNLLFPGSGKKVWWKCSLGHEWETTIARRTTIKGTGCPVCYKTNLELQKLKILDSDSSYSSLTRGKPVKCVQTKEVFSSASAAERIMRSRGKSVLASKVLLCCKGKRKSSGGYQWQWK